MIGGLIAAKQGQRNAVSMLKSQMLHFSDAIDGREGEELPEIEETDEVEPEV